VAVSVVIAATAISLIWKWRQSSSRAPTDKPITSSVATGGHATGGSANATGNQLIVNFPPAPPRTPSPGPTPSPIVLVSIPTIRVVEEHLFSKSFALNPNSYDKFTATFWFVRFRNAATGSKQLCTAKNVRADLVFSSLENDFNLHVDGFWLHDFADV